MNNLSTEFKFPDPNTKSETPITEDDYKTYDNAKDLKDAAKLLGEKYINNWLIKRETDIKNILSCFDTNGKVLPNNGKNLKLTATAFNDLYKWTMMPVIRAMEKSKQNEYVSVTFGIDLRDERSKYLISQEKFRDALFENLQEMVKRPFDQTIFKNCLVAPVRDNLIDDDTIKKICGANDTPRTLAKEVITNKPNPHDTDDDVRVYLYNTGEKNGWVVEATGPWHKVTWLETSMMQCVYQTMLTYDLILIGKSYSTWLLEAITRCAKSVAFTHLINLGNKKSTPALFTGRRTGGLAFLLLQNLFFADHFKQFSLPNMIIIENSKYNELILQGKSFICLGTSSCESNYFLKTKFKLPCLNPAGTHAHELSMVSSVLYPSLDNNEKLFPYTQVLGHYLYYVLSYRVGPVPMLPDTLGTCAFINAAKNTKLYKKEFDMNAGREYQDLFFNKITTARQDSGKLENFNDYLKISEYTKTNTKMASEIDDTETLFKAVDLEYTTFGAGGFFGDSAKVWSDKVDNEKSNNKESEKLYLNENTSYSMAIKAVRVIYAKKDTQSSTSEVPYIKIDGKNVIGYPIKLGDINFKYDPNTSNDEIFSAGVKLSIDKNIDDELKDKIVKYAENVRKINIIYTYSKPEDSDKKEISELLLESNITIESSKLKGGRKTIKKHNRMKRTTRRLSKTKRFRKRINRVR
jgi:hypothetical protein